MTRLIQNHWSSRLGIILTLPLLAAGFAPATIAQTLVGSGSAFGTEVTVEGVVEAGRTAPTGMGCSLDPVFNENVVAGVDLSPVLTTGTVHTTARRVHLDGGEKIRARTTSEIEDVSILGGVITASAAFSNAVAELTPSGFTARSSGSELVGVTLLGIPLGATPDPNTTLDLVGFGSVTFNERIHDVRANRASQQTRMIHVVVSLPNPLVPVGTEITVASARAALNNGGGRLGGTAFGGSVEAGDLALLDKMLRIGMPCGGTGGEVRSRTGVAVDLPGVLSSGTVRNTMQGEITPTEVEAVGTSTIEGVDVLLGLVSADVIKARTRIHGPLDDFSRGEGQSGFVNLQVAGFPEISDDVAFNTRLDIAGLGDLWLKRRIRRNPNAIQVRMIWLVVREENVFGLPIGADLRVAQAGLNVKQP